MITKNKLIKISFLTCDLKYVDNEHGNTSSSFV